MPFDSQGNWKPNPKQGQFLSIPDSVKEAGYLGGAGSGKSELLLMMPIVRKWHECVGFKQLFVRRTYPELKREIVPRSFEMYPQFGGKFNKTDMCWTFESGACIFLGHCENESDVHLYDSMEINLFTPDEITSFSEYIYTYIGFTRVRTSKPNLPAIIRCAGMPGGIGHGWVKKRFIDPYPKGNKIVVGRGNNKRIFIFATLEDNKDHIDPNYSQSLDALPEAERQAKKFGSFDAYSGQVFNEFRDKHYPDEPENALHVVAPFEIPSFWPRVLAIDWGYNAMTSVGWATVSPFNRVYIYRHQMFHGVKIAEWVNEVKLFVDRDKPKDIVICHSAGQNRGDPHTIQEQVVEVLGESVRLGERDRIGGKSLIHEYLRWMSAPVPTSELKPFDQNLAQWIFRNQGPDAYSKYLALYQPLPLESNLPKLQLFNIPDVMVIADALKACVYEKSSDTGKKKEDVAEFNGDDPYDMLRMLLHSVDNFFGVASSEQSKLNALQGVIDTYQASGDNTSYYRNMRTLESKEQIHAVTRYHRRRRI